MKGVDTGVLWNFIIPNRLIRQKVKSVTKSIKCKSIHDNKYYEWPFCLIVGNENERSKFNKVYQKDWFPCTECLITKLLFNERTDTNENWI